MKHKKDRLDRPISTKSRKKVKIDRELRYKSEIAAMSNDPIVLSDIKEIERGFSHIDFIEINQVLNDAF